MDGDLPHLPYDSRRARRGSSSFSMRMSGSMPSSLRFMSAADWLLAASIAAALSVVAAALYYTR